MNNHGRSPMIRFSRLSLAATILLAFVALYVVISATNATAQQIIGKSWPVGQQVSINNVDHSAFHTLLQKYVDQNGMVDYSAWHSSAGDRLALQNYLQHLGSANVSLKSDRANQLAFWINAYNAITLEGILQVYPTTSIRNHTAKLVGYNIWKDLKLPVGNGIDGGLSYSLEQIEHEILRKANEPRIHFAIVCASIGCPRLLNEAYLGKSLEDQLKKNTVDFFSRQQNLDIDTGNRTLRLSAILKWFAEDFGKNTQQQVLMIEPFFPEEAKQFVAEGNYRVRYLDYNWDLNDRSSR